MNGVLNIYKPKGITSFDVVKCVRKLTKEKKVGHAGTLDPMACGVLPVCIGKGTKIIDYIMSNTKVYCATLKLGITTDTYDKTGKILTENKIEMVNEKEIKNAFDCFLGEINQIPPMYSALKKNGKKLYELARQGIEIERSARPITIYSIEILNIDLPYIKFKVKCSKGTYIRSLCYDIGNVLKCGATMWELERLQTGPFKFENSIELSNLTSENVKSNLISIEDVLCKYDNLNVNEKMLNLLKNGVTIRDKGLINNIPSNKMYKIYFENLFIGIAQKTDQYLKMIKLLY